VIGALRTFGRFWLDFVVGDDWRIAAGILVLVAAGAALVHGGVLRTGAIAVLLPALLVALVAASILYDARRSR
jgi:uncharacterized membrane protein YoaK (UPF0700 family)